MASPASKCTGWGRVLRTEISQIYSLQLTEHCTFTFLETLAKGILNRITCSIRVTRSQRLRSEILFASTGTKRRDNFEVWESSNLSLQDEMVTTQRSCCKSAKCVSEPLYCEDRSCEIRLFTVLYFSVRSSRSRALRYGLPILHECQNYLRGGGGLGGSEKNILQYFSRPSPPPPSYNPRRPPPRYIWKSR